MEWVVWHFWWLIFPIMGFAFGAFGMWMNYRAHRDRMELLRTYAAQGKDPTEVARMLQGDAALNGWGGQPWGSPGWGPAAYGGWGWGRWGYWGPMREWRRTVIFGCLTAGFGIASYFAEFPGTAHAFFLVAVIMGVLAAGSLVMAIVSTAMTRQPPPPDGR